MNQVQKDKAIVQGIEIFIVSMCVITFLLEESGMNFAFNRYYNTPDRLLLYTFSHGSILHLAMNMWVFFLERKSIEYLFTTRKLLLFLFVSYLFITFSIYQFSIYPVIGISGIICAFIGYISIFIYEKTKEFSSFQNVIWIVALSFLMPRVSIIGHISGLAIGVLFYLMEYVFRKNMTSN